MPDFAGSPPVLVTPPAEHISLPVRPLEALLERVNAAGWLNFTDFDLDPLSMLRRAGLRFPKFLVLKTMLGWSGLAYGNSLQDRLTADQEESLIAAEPHVVRVA